MLFMGYFISGLDLRMVVVSHQCRYRLRHLYRRFVVFVVFVFFVAVVVIVFVVIVNVVNDTTF